MKNFYSNKEPDASVIIPSYNCARYIGHLLQSLQKQNTDYAFEVIIVDSGTDDTAELVRRDFSWVNLVRSETRLHPGQGRNLGIENAKTDLFLFTDTDCRVGELWVNDIVNGYRAGKQIIVGPVMNGTPRSIWGTVEYLLEFFDSWNVRNGVKIGPCGTLNVFFTRDIFTKYGPFDIYLNGSDSRFFRRTLAGGASIYWQSDVRVWHHNRTKLRAVIRNQFKLGKGAAKTGREFKSRNSFMVEHPYLIPLVPILRSIRIGWILLRKCPQNFLIYLLLYPLALAGLIVHGYGFACCVLEKNRETRHDR